MKKVKALIAMVALVATIGVASVASAETVIVAGTVAESTDLQNCTGATFAALDTHAVADSTSCTGTMIWNTLPGYQLKYNAVDANLTHSNDTDVILGGAACTTTECFSYKFDSSDDDDTPVGAEIVEHAVPTTATIQTAGVAWEGDYGFTFYAVTETDTPAGTYDSQGTVLVNVTP